MQFKMHVKPNNRNDSWWEDYDKPEAVDQVSAEREAQKIIDFFNSTLRPYESPRTLLAVVLIETNGAASKSFKAHEWEKTNLVTVHERGRYFDRLVCPKCGVTAKRFGVTSIVIDPKYKAKVYRDCDTAREWLQSVNEPEAGSGDNNR